MKLLFLGDVVGQPGRKAVLDHLSGLKAEYEADFAIVNGENAAGGRGITPKICIDLLRAGAAVVTSGDHIWDQAEIVPHFASEPRLLRPLNYPPETPGQGSVVLETEKGRVAVINVQARTFMNQALENPLLAVEAEVAKLRADGVRVIFVDVHGETTSEKAALAWALDGTVSAVVGTHTHVQTADERVLPGGTAFLTDAGMCGPRDSILGRKVSAIVQRLRTSMPTRFPVADGAVILSGVVVDVDEQSGLARHIERIQRIH